MADFTEWKLDDGTDAIQELIEAQVGEDAFSVSKAYVEDQDHWQDGDRWVGPNGGSDAIWKKRVKDAVERSFAPVGAVEEILGRMANALLKKEPDVDFVPLEAPENPDTDAAKALEAEAADLKAVVSDWWDRRKLWELARQAVVRSRWASRGALRTWIAPAHLVRTETEGEDGTATVVTALPTGLDLAEGLKRVQVSAESPDVVAVYTDEETQRRAAIFLFDDGEEGDGQAAELWYTDGEGDDARTVMRVLRKESTEEFSVPLGGRLPILEMEADLLITDPVRAQQAQLDFFSTLLSRVVETAGFAERYTLNAEPTGVWLDTPPTDGPALEKIDQDGRTWYLHPASRELGAMITTDLIGITMETGEGERRATPGVQFKEPTDPEFAIKAKKEAYYTLLKQCKQGHIATEGTAEASGEAYQQARADYEDDLDSVRGPLESLIRETITVAIAWAEAMGNESVLDRFRVVVSLHVKSGRTSPEEQRQNNANMKSGTLSQETAMAANGVEDVDAELTKLRSQPDFVAGLRKEQTTAILEFVREGVSYELAGLFVGIEEGDEALKVLKRMDQLRTAPGAEEDAQDEEVADALLRGTRAIQEGDGGRDENEEVAA